MTNIILPTSELEKQADVPEYQPTPEDEEKFFCMYHLKFQPSEVTALDPSYRRWLIMRFMAQKELENEAFERRRLMQTIGPNMKTGA